ncbi:unnamed protein product [Darwinula stevensoni]|uniref:Uncharacterized protein n=1 Tax=Darwinula stevensoni TaxID=69355 RepID=A0A7R8X9T4_9CRUS|nr:unnamed protein product [Darwinula stevensoni]CAG0891425.1 unnamed protein product [Darwinula stevensoni]
MKNYGRRRTFLIESNFAVEDLLEDVFGNMTFDEIRIWDTSLAEMDTSMLLSSKDRLEMLTIGKSPLGEFPFHILPQMTLLSELNLDEISLKSVPALESPSLKNLIISNNKIDALKPSWSTPTLESLDISYNPISEIPRGLLKGFRNLVSFEASHCSLGPTLPKGSLTFRSDVLSNVSVGFNGIVRLEPGAITGLTSETTVDLRENSITEMTEESFRPMLETLSLPQYENNNAFKEDPDTGLAREGSQEAGIGRFNESENNETNSFPHLLEINSFGSIILQGALFLRPHTAQRYPRDVPNWTTCPHVFIGYPEDIFFRTVSDISKRKNLGTLGVGRQDAWEHKAANGNTSLRLGDLLWEKAAGLSRSPWSGEYASKQVSSGYVCSMMPYSTPGASAANGGDAERSRQQNISQSSSSSPLKPIEQSQDIPGLLKKLLYVVQDINKNVAVQGTALANVQLSVKKMIPPCNELQLPVQFPLDTLSSLEIMEDFLSHPANVNALVEAVMQAFKDATEHKVQGDIKTCLRNAPAKWTKEQAKKMKMMKMKMKLKPR